MIVLIRFYSNINQSEQILKSNASESNKQQSIEQLRNSAFATKEDLLRAQSYEIMNDQKKLN